MAQSSLRPTMHAARPELDTRTHTPSTTTANPLSTANHHQQPAIVRTTSSHGDLPLRHPAPDLNLRLRSGISAGNIAQLEATAERLSLTSSIDDAIRDAHQELKRSDSRKSSILAASLVRQTAAFGPADPSATSTTSATTGPSSRPLFSRQNSIVDFNSTARAGVLFPPSHSSVGCLTSQASPLSNSSHPGSASKASSDDNACLAASPITSTALSGPNSATYPDDTGTPSRLPRHAAGRITPAARTTRSTGLPLPGISEMDLPMTLTQDNLDEADRLMALCDEYDASDTIRSPGAYRTLDFHHNAASYEDISLAHDSDPHSTAAMAATASSYMTTQDVHPAASSNNHNHNPPQRTADPSQRPSTSGTQNTFDQAQTAFGDFDGVHCNPDPVALRPPSVHSTVLSPTSTHAPHPPAAARPTSYLDPESGQQMLYYPAPVPAMLQLPPKLSKRTNGAERDKTRFQILSTMMQENQASQDSAPQRHSWLPDPLSGPAGSPLLDTDDHFNAGTQPAHPLVPLRLDGAEVPSPAASSPEVDDFAEKSSSAADLPRPNNSASNLRLPARLHENDKRKSHVSQTANIAPQVRASVFFDPPATTPDIILKNASATETLESILDAAVHAPVAAFTHHAFAGKLGAEVYGSGKRRSMMNAATLAGQQMSNARSSFLTLTGRSRKASATEKPGADRRSILPQANGSGNDAAAGDATSGSSPGIGDNGSAAWIRHVDDEQSSEQGGQEDGHRHSLSADDVTSEARDDNADDGNEDTESGDDEETYEGPPTTLLAELQLRKQQQKLRTKPIHQAFPNGMHSTLLELDAVAEVEHQARKSKRVNLAWEAAALNADHDSDADDDIPLGVLYTARAAGERDLAVVMANMHRPLGLMEKKELEDNEPLSKRRSRLQGHGSGAGMYLSDLENLNKSKKRLSMFTMAPTPATLDSAGALKGGGDGVDGEEGAAVEEVEDEPLAARLQRIKAKEESELPRARPVSMAFSAELLEQFRDPDEEAKQEEEKKKNDRLRGLAPNGRTNEADETLGQRRRRLQAEKEARNQEMLWSSSANKGFGVNDQALEALTGSNRLSRRLSLSNILASHPAGSGRPPQNPHPAVIGKGPAGTGRPARQPDHWNSAFRSQMAHPMPAGISNNVGFAGGSFAGGFGGGVPGLAYGGQQPSFWPGYSGMAAASFPFPAGAQGSIPSQSMGSPHMQNASAMGLAVPGSSTNLGMSNVPMGMAGLNAAFGGPYGLMQQQPMGMGLANSRNFLAAGANTAVAGHGGIGFKSYGGYGAMQPQPLQPQGQIDRVERWRQGVQP